LPPLNAPSLLRRRGNDAELERQRLKRDWPLALVGAALEAPSPFRLAAGMLDRKANIAPHHYGRHTSRLGQDRQPHKMLHEGAHDLKHEFHFRLVHAVVVLHVGVLILDIVVHQLHEHIRQLRRATIRPDVRAEICDLISDTSICECLLVQCQSVPVILEQCRVSSIKVSFTSALECSERCA
jgi:hypothetical protein